MAKSLPRRTVGLLIEKLIAKVEAILREEDLHLDNSGIESYFGMKCEAAPDGIPCQCFTKSVLCVIKDALLNSDPPFDFERFRNDGQFQGQILLKLVQRYNRRNAMGEPKFGTLSVSEMYLHAYETFLGCKVDDLRDEPGWVVPDVIDPTGKVKRRHELRGHARSVSEKLTRLQNRISSIFAGSTWRLYSKNGFTGDIVRAVIWIHGLHGMEADVTLRNEDRTKYPYEGWVDFQFAEYHQIRLHFETEMGSKFLDLYVECDVQRPTSPSILTGLLIGMDRNKRQYWTSVLFERLENSEYFPHAFPDFVEAYFASSRSFYHSAPQGIIHEEQDLWKSIGPKRDAYYLNVN